ncbi:MAG: YHS domain-containing protein [Nitrospiria bacterium]
MPKSEQPPIGDLFWCHLLKGDDQMVKDPVCGMQVDEKKVTGTSNYKGKTYYFCSVSCKEKFETKPENFIKQ